MYSVLKTKIVSKDKELFGIVIWDISGQTFNVILGKSGFISMIDFSERYDQIQENCQNFLLTEQADPALSLNVKRILENNSTEIFKTLSITNIKVKIKKTDLLLKKILPHSILGQFILFHKIEDSATPIFLNSNLINIASKQINKEKQEFQRYRYRIPHTFNVSYSDLVEGKGKNSKFIEDVKKDDIILVRLHKNTIFDRQIFEQYDIPMTDNVLPASVFTIGIDHDQIQIVAALSTNLMTICSKVHPQMRVCDGNFLRNSMTNDLHLPRIDKNQLGQILNKKEERIQLIILGLIMLGIVLFLLILTLV